MEKHILGTIVGIAIVCLLFAGLHNHRRRPDPMPTPGPIPAPAPVQRQLVYFSATWCVPCQRMKSTFSDPDVVRCMQNTTLVRHDIDRDKDHAKKHSVTTVPTYILFENGRELRRASGYKSPHDFAAWLGN